MYRDNLHGIKVLIKFPDTFYQVYLPWQRRLTPTINLFTMTTAMMSNSLTGRNVHFARRTLMRVFSAQPNQRGKQTLELVIDMYIQKFIDIDRLPSQIMVSYLDNGSGIAVTLEKNQASWHKSCHHKISNEHVEHAKSLKRKLE